MDKLKKQILKSFTKYVYKLQKGYQLNKKDYKKIIEAMRSINALENFTFPKEVQDAIISLHLQKLKE